MAEINLPIPLTAAPRAESGASPIDTTVDIITPENISFNYRVAGPFRRFPAYVIDTTIKVVVMIGLVVWALLTMVFLAQFAVLAGTVEFLESMAMVWGAVLVVVWFLVNWFYGALFEAYMNGRTPGKWVLGIRVLTEEGRPINGLQAIFRNVLRFADTMPMVSIQAFGFVVGENLESPEPGSGGLLLMLLLISLVMMGIPTFALGLLVMTSTRRFQRIGDLVCGTMVVAEERSWLMGVARVEDPRTAQLASLLPPKFEVSRSLAKTLATYVERRRFFSQARRREIARHLGEPLLRIFGMPPDTSHDLLLCALYYRTFIADKGDDAPLPPVPAEPYPAYGNNPPYGPYPGPYPPHGPYSPQAGEPGIMFDPPPLPQQNMAGPHTGPFNIRP